MAQNIEIKVSIDLKFLNINEKQNCVKSVRIRRYSGSHFPAFRLNTERFKQSNFAMNLRSFRNSLPEAFLRKGVLIVCSKFKREHP